MLYILLHCIYVIKMLKAYVNIFAGLLSVFIKRMIALLETWLRHSDGGYLSKNYLIYGKVIDSSSVGLCESFCSIILH